MLKNLILSAAAAGVAAGVLTAVIQHVTTTPIIIEAEKYESGAAAHDHGVAEPAHDQNAAEPAAIQATGHEEEGWAPADGLARTFFTSLATTVLGVGFGLALLGAMSLAGVSINARTGLAFGIAGFISVVARAGARPAAGDSRKRRRRRSTCGSSGGSSRSPRRRSALPG